MDKPFHYFSPDYLRPDVESCVFCGVYVDAVETKCVGRATIGRQVDYLCWKLTRLRALSAANEAIVGELPSWV